MSSQEKKQSVGELGLMQGFPPIQAGRVTLQKQMFASPSMKEHAQSLWRIYGNGIRWTDPLHSTGSRDGGGQVQLISYTHASQQRILQCFCCTACTGKMAGRESVEKKVSNSRY